eukprot:XP_011445674.1 PREDICTED: uncharacterized protein LOC105341074 [Crassostrea gigas]
MLLTKIETLIMMVAIIIVNGKKTLPSPEFYIDAKNGETGRYFVSSGNYLCHYGGANTLENKGGAFSAQCFNQNKNRLSRREEESRTYPYFDSSVGAPPGCGPLPVVKDGEWECPGDVSSLSVPVYESCHIVCKGNSVQKRALVKVRCTEKLEWDRVLTSNACSVEKSSGEHPSQDPDIMKVSLTIVLVFAVAVLILLCVFRRFKRLICNNLQNILCNTVPQDNNIAPNPVDIAGMEDEDHQQIVVTKNAAKYKMSTGNNNVEKEQSNSNVDQCTCDSNGTLQTKDLTDIDISQETTFNNLNISNARTGVDGMRKPNIPLNNDVDQLYENVEPNPSLPLSQLLASDDKTNALVISSMKTDLRNVKEDKAFEESFLRSQNEHAEPCPTIAAMLEGAVNDSIRFVDDLSTLLDPDNPRNWQGLAQSYFNMSFNKIKEIRHKTKDHFKEALLPLLSSHGYRIFDLTYYFYKLPSRRIDIIECIQRYHPYCRDCGEIYSHVKSRKEKY